MPNELKQSDLIPQVTNKTFCTVYTGHYCIHYKDKLNHGSSGSNNSIIAKAKALNIPIIDIVNVPMKYIGSDLQTHLDNGAKVIHYHKLKFVCARCNKHNTIEISNPAFIDIDSEYVCSNCQENESNFQDVPRFQYESTQYNQN